MTDPGEASFSGRVKLAIPGINIHGSPYRDYQAGNIAALIDQLPPEDGVFVWGTSLGANDTFVTCSYTKHIIDGAFMFQASIYGAKSAATENVKFAHLIYSESWIPLPGLGAYIPAVGTMNPESYHQTEHDIPHPGDYDLNDQNTFIKEMQNIVKATNR